MANDKHQTISSWSEDARPRERLLALGARALTNAELLALLIHSGTPSQNAVELMSSVLEKCDGSLIRLGEMSYKELTEFKGIGQAKAVTILAACEFGRRRLDADNVERKVLDSSKIIFYDVLRSELVNKPEEHCWVVLLDQGLHLISKECIGKGGITAVSADIRVVLRLALQKNAVNIVLAHNHPSGSLKPSREDDRTTRNLADACKIMNIRLLDHIIVGGNRYYSYAEEGKL
jgi:DNA repair protein RadC